MANTIEWREVTADEGTGLEGQCGKYDFCITTVEGVFALDVFRAGVPNDDAEAYVDTLQAETLDDAKALAAAYDEEQAIARHEAEANDHDLGGTFTA